MLQASQACNAWSQSPSEATECLTADNIPDLSNQFVLVYCSRLEGDPALPSRKDLIHLTEQMCQWFYENQISSSRLLRAPEWASV